MSTIKFADLQLTHPLFTNSESYLRDLSDTEQKVQGGIWAVYALAFLVGFSATYFDGN